MEGERERERRGNASYFSFISKEREREDRARATDVKHGDPESLFQLLKVNLFHDSSFGTYVHRGSLFPKLS